MLYSALIQEKAYSIAYTLLSFDLADQAKYVPQDVIQKIDKQFCIWFN